MGLEYFRVTFSVLSKNLLFTASKQESPQLKPVKRTGNRRYYQRQDVITIRQIRSLLYDEGFTIGGARNRLEGDEAREDNTQARQVIRQVRAELEELLRILRR